MRLAVLALSALLALAAQALVAPASAQTGNPTNDQLLSRNQAGQRDAFRSLLRTNGLACSEVSNLYQAGLDRGRTAYWDIQCRDGGPWRIALPAERWSTPRLLACGTASGPGAGACFRPVGTAVPQAARLATRPTSIPQSCQRACATQPRALVQACQQRCAEGSAIPVAAPAIRGTAQAARGRFGFIYTAEPPSTAFGFTSGQGDRLAASMEAIRACEAVVGRNQCRITLDFPNACGALAQAVSGTPAILRRSATGAGQTREQAEAQALQVCRIAERAGSGIVCRIAASGC
ncbi:DUF4189 domain-containing protein [Falsiroseomonas selenitidurans]|uniref:DUF4189 domain-containing protein n=1 Tax=Falsiroseomonas selenitidurans TaxID=2716335 RepID=A0ABX1E541_9PROT|nr:DUF4189 domain-containing protein [Falsiroseomonas selenitidurans]NKC30055.1 DUF4189 domain-containing protein [Falsiroseomonas selenitidurans]